MKDNNEINTIAITGASGFIGKALVNALSACSNISLRILVRKLSDNNAGVASNVTEIQGDFTKPETLVDFLIPGCTVINLAYSFSSTREQNISAVNNLIEICKNTSIKRLIHCSTAAVYGRSKEDAVDESSECSPRSRYGKTKLLIEETFYTASLDYFEYINLRPTSVYGPGGHSLMKLINQLLNGSVVLNYIRSCLFNARNLNLVHVSNVVSAIIFFIYTNKDVDRETYIISEDFDSRNNFSYVENFLSHQLLNRYYSVPPIKFPFPILSFLLRCRGDDSINPRMKYMPEKIKQLGFNYNVNIDSGLDDFIKWYKQENNLDFFGDA